MATQTTLVSGTFSGTGTSDDIVIPNKGFLTLDFAGTATVSLQVFENDTTWLDVDSYTADTVKSIEGCNQRFRLNCSSHTDNVVYAIKKVRASSVA